MTTRARVTLTFVALALAAGCSVRADLGGTDGASQDAADARPAPEVAAEAATEAAPEVATETAAEAQMTEPDASGARPGAGTPASCDDNLLDGDETDVDCGGACAPCGLSQRCRVAADCGLWPGCDPILGCACDAQTKTCVYNHCSDYVKDFGETAVDCGGGECGGCGPQKACVLDSDCSQSLPGCGPGGCACDLATSTCVYDHCYDHKNDVDETGLDCGGTLCGGCALGAPCEYDYDCLSQACDLATFLCVSNSCIDHRQDASETDVDCGGGTCGACAIGMKCKVNSDCQTGFCAGYLVHVCD